MGFAGVSTGGSGIFDSVQCGNKDRIGNEASANWWACGKFFRRYTTSTARVKIALVGEEERRRGGEEGEEKR